ncbi:glycerate kinase, partial [Kipferlia bialata]
RVCGVVSEELSPHGYTCDQAVLSDGGEGFLSAMTAITQCSTHTVTVQGPLNGVPVEAQIGYDSRTRTCFVEMAQASGLELLSVSDRDPEATSTYGTGELLSACLSLDVTPPPLSIMLGIGGSATCDAGLGCAQALGVVFTDREGAPITAPLTGGTLSSVHGVDSASVQRVRDAFRGVSLMVACDVDNVLLGSSGSVYVYAPQKGASPDALVRLEAGMAHVAPMLDRQTEGEGERVSMMPGAGAAGGIAAGLSAFCQAELVTGSALVCRALSIRDRAEGAVCVLTGEGRFDKQSLMGKVVSAVVDATPVDVPVGIICGTSLLHKEGETETHPLSLPCTSTVSGVRAVSIPRGADTTKGEDKTVPVFALTDTHPIDLCLSDPEPILRSTVRDRVLPYLNSL